MGLISRACVGLACFALVGGADAQTASQLLAPLAGGGPTVRAPKVNVRQPLSDQEQAILRQALDAAQSGDIDRARDLRNSLADPVARKLVLWEMVDSAPDRLSFFELDQARRDLWGWPHESRREAAAEKQLETQGMAPQAVISWFNGKEPITPEGAMALAAAYQAAGRGGDAKALIRHFWRDKVFEDDQQQRMLARFGGYLTTDDYVRRADLLLYGPQGPAARDVVSLLPADQQALANARIAYRSDLSNADLSIEGLSASQLDSPGLAYERARYLHKHDEDELAISLIPDLPKSFPDEDAASAVWKLRRALVVAALQARNYKAAYQAAAENGLSPGVDYAEAEFYAGWIALTKLNDPAEADKHFANIQQVGASPITMSRALYWRGRASEAMGDQIGAKDFYAQAAQYPTTFYGQLAGERAGLGEFDLGHDPVPTAADRARFDGRETVQAARMLADLGEKGLFRSFVLNIDDTLPNAEEYALLVDLARGYGEQDLSMRVARVAAQHGYILPDRGYPVMDASSAGSSAEAALVLAIARQESNFDPTARSGPGARGMMQLMPSTAAIVARKLGEPFSPNRLYDPAYNVRLGSAYIENMIDNFGGSYAMAIASYNAGPNHMPQWTATCGDPRATSTDPVDFIECIPLSETRNYVMRVMEGMEVYRARLHGGHAPLTLAEDLKRGGYTPGPASLVASAASTRPSEGPRGPGTMAPIPD